MPPNTPKGIAFGPRRAAVNITRRNTNASRRPPVNARTIRQRNTRRRPKTPEVGGKQLRHIIYYDEPTFNSFFVGLDAAEQDRLLGLLYSVAIKGREGVMNVFEIMNLSKEKFDEFAKNFTEKHVHTYNAITTSIKRIHALKSSA